MTAPLSPLQARAARLQELYDQATPATQDAITNWFRQTGYYTMDYLAMLAMASLLLAAIEAEQEPEQDRPALWVQWFKQAKRYGIERDAALLLACQAENISRQIYGTPKG